uniref:Uncharacterized protein n=1 Tax=Timema cristinae TaxID=61476 RepID=A0A7R9HAH3_TIMCR|nr:unnamed protein product [Timema cristinae]
MIQGLELSGVEAMDLYNGNFSLLLDMAPHLAAFNVNTYEIPELAITTIYNDTAQHSLPIVLNILSNTFYRLIMKEMEKDVEPIVVKTHPFQQTSQPEEFNMGTFSSSLFIGMIFVLVPVSLAVDMVYDRELHCPSPDHSRLELRVISGTCARGQPPCPGYRVRVYRGPRAMSIVPTVQVFTTKPVLPRIRAKNQLRVNGLSFFMYFLTYFMVLAGIMLFICAALLGLIFMFDLPSLREPPAFCTLGVLILLYCPASILFATCVSYIFDKMDSAQSILPNIVTFVGLIPFILVMFLDMLRIGKWK